VSLRPVDLIVRLEWLAAFAAAIAGYVLVGGSWLLFLMLILAPDLSMLGYLGGPRAGALVYNAFHTLLAPVALLAAGVLSDSGLAVQIAAVWIAHIAIDRALGYGLKLSTGFSDTHLGRIGRR
jgi:hypothetical protein